MSHADLRFYQDEAFDVQPSQIERVLQQLWRDTAEGDAAVMHVRTLNLLVLAPAGQATPELMRAVEIASVQHPGRTVLMLVTDDSQPPRARATIACRIGGGGKQICGEQITITSGEGGAALPSIAAALLVPGVPTFLWWMGDPDVHNPLFADLAEITDRLIVDSRTWHAPFVSLLPLAAAIEQSAHIAYTDLHWTALTPWRRMLAQCFDLPDARIAPQRIEHMTIEHGWHESDRLGAMLLIGWLASRLNWQTRRVTRERLEFTTGSGNVQIELVAHKSVDGMQRIALACSNATIRLEFLPATGCIKTVIELAGAASIERMAHLAPQRLEHEISEDLNMLQHDTGYEQALQFTATLVGQATE